MIGDSPNELESLANRSSTGDARAFELLVQKTHRLAYQLALRMLGNREDAEDVLQDSYLRVWSGLPGLRDRGVVLGWICSIIRNVAADRIRRHGRQRRRIDYSVELDRLLEDTAADQPDPEERVADIQHSKTIATALASLRDKHRAVLLLREIDGMSYDEISVALDIPIGTVESRLYRARRELAAKLARAFERSKSEAA
jgi:RNA polymerase sigma-70 factor (ECF subfamily)